MLRVVSAMEEQHKVLWKILFMLYVVSFQVIYALGAYMKNQTVGFTKLQ